MNNPEKKIKPYDHAKIEKKWQKEWTAKKIYKTEDKSKKEKFYILDMFPYPSGEGLHVGHPKGYIATDIMSRMKRMQGFNVLHPMGFDAFGLPAENYAIKTKTNPQVSVAKNVARYKKQLEIIGLDYDWSREVNTTDPKFYKWTQWIFLKLLEKGLAFESNEPVNWCPVDKTVLANEDVENGHCERCGALVEKKAVRQWVLKITDYADRLLSDLDMLDWPESIKESQRNWIGRSEGAEITFPIEFSRGQKPGAIPVFSTRPDTLYGATALMLSPEHLWVTLALDKNHVGVLDNATEVRAYVKKAAEKTEIERTDAKREKTGIKLEGVWAVNPASKEKIPVFVADYVLADYGTGAVMAVPAHDERDFEFAQKYGQKYGMEIKHVIIPRRVDHKNPHVPGKEVVFRNAVMAIVIDRKTNSFLCLKWKNLPWTTFVMGGIEKGENAEAAARREVEEETGYKNLKLVRVLGGATQSEFYAAHKGVNRIAHTQAVFFELENKDRNEIAQEETVEYEAVWLDAKDVTPEKITHIETDVILDKIFNGEKPYTGEGILIHSGPFDMKNSADVKKAITESVGGKWVTKYKLRDWVFSRQRYWGEPIPVLHDLIQSVDGTTMTDVVVPVAEKDLPVVLPKVKSYEPTDNAESPLASIPKWVNVKVVQGKGTHKVTKILRRETNTMPQWAGSSWYYLRYMDPKNDKALVDPVKEKYWSNLTEGKSSSVDMYVGGAEHATRHLIYARFWHKFLYDIGVVSTQEPFQRLQGVGLIQAADGRKMSKRFGNVINPDDVVATYGADTLRIYEMFLGPFDQTAVWSTESIIGTRRFVEKVWRLQTKVIKKITKITKATKTTEATNATANFSTLDTLVNKTIQKITDDIVAMRFNTCISALMIMANAFEKEEGISSENFEIFLKLLAPFAPHIADELWANMGHKKTIHHEMWPKPDPAKLIEDQVTIAIQINGKTRAELKIASNSPESAILEAAKALPSVQKWLEGSNTKKVIYVKNRLINIVLDVDTKTGSQQS